MFVGPFYQSNCYLCLHPISATRRLPISFLLFTPLDGFSEKCMNASPNVGLCLAPLLFFFPPLGSFFFPRMAERDGHRRILPSGGGRRRESFDFFSRFFFSVAFLPAGCSSRRSAVNDICPSPLLSLRPPIRPSERHRPLENKQMFATSVCAYLPL